MAQGRAAEIYLLALPVLRTLPLLAGRRKTKLYAIADLQRACLAAHGSAAGLAAALRARADKRARRDAREAAKPPKPDRGSRCKGCKRYYMDEAGEHDASFDEDEDCCFDLCASCCVDSGQSVCFCPRHNPAEYAQARDEAREFDDDERGFGRGGGGRSGGGRYGGGRWW
jgi:hypothetical protein